MVPRDKEEEYFAREDSEKRRAQREKAAAEARKAEQKLHFMHCPKCGAELHPETLRGVQIARCNECRGVFFEAEELEHLVGRVSTAVTDFLAFFKSKEGQRD